MPKRKKPGRKDFDTNPEAVRRWVEDLPLINTDRAREMLEQALKQINTLDIHPLDRNEGLELLSTPVLCVADALKNDFIGQQIPLPDRHLAKARQCLELYNQIAIGYEIMAADLRRTAGTQPGMAAAIHRAMRYISEALLTSYQIYQQYPAGLWKGLHTLYSVAEQAGVASRTVTDNTLQSATRSTIETVYKQILLLSLACPYRLRQKEIQYVYNALLGWSAVSRLSSDTENQDSGLFATNLLSDDPPAYRSLNSNTAMDDNWRILDTSRMGSLLNAAASGDFTGPGTRTGIDL